jgi:hypothetical protein
VNSIRKELKPQTLLIRDNEGTVVSNREKALQRWPEYYEKHFELQDRTENHRGEEGIMCVQTAEPEIKPPSDVDIGIAIGKLKNGKATGHDQIPAELIKEGGTEIRMVT